MKRIPDMTDRHALPVFTAAGRAWTVGEVLAFARRTDRSPPTERRRAAGTSDRATLDSALRDFRYARDLVSADDCTRWLALRGLDYSALQDSLRRRMNGLDAIQPQQEIDFLLGPAFDRCARALGWRVAQAHEGGVTDCCLESLDSGFAAARAELLDSAVRARRLRSLQHRLSTIHFELAEFDSVDAANEAWCCVRDDGEALGSLARQNGTAHCVMSKRLDALPDSWAMRLALAPTGQPLPPFEDNGRHLVLLPLTRRPASLDDDRVADAIDQMLTASHFDALAARHLHWQVPIHPELPDSTRVGQP